MQTSNKPLWQKLNEERTQGTWNLFKDNLNREWNIISKDKFEILTIANKWRASETNEANAAYTALAVNNLHVLSEALQYIIDLIEPIPVNSKNHLNRTVIENECLNKAKEVLNRIS